MQTDQLQDTSPPCLRIPCVETPPLKVKQGVRHLDQVPFNANSIDALEEKHANHGEDCESEDQHSDVLNTVHFRFFLHERRFSPGQLAWLTEVKRERLTFRSASADFLEKDLFLSACPQLPRIQLAVGSGETISASTRKLSFPRENIASLSLLLRGRSLGARNKQHFQGVTQSKQSDRNFKNEISKGRANRSTFLVSFLERSRWRLRKQVMPTNGEIAVAAENPFMKYQFWIAAAFGLAAFAINILSAEKKAQTMSYLVLNTSVQAGDRIVEEDFEVHEILPDYVPEGVVNADQLDQILGTYYKRPERKGAVVLNDLVIRPSESYSLNLAADEIPLRIPLPGSMKPMDFVIGTRINILVTHENENGELQRSEFTNFPIVSIGSNTDRFDDTWVEDSQSQDFIRIAVKREDIGSLALQAASEGRNGYRVVDVYSRTKK